MFFSNVIFKYLNFLPGYKTNIILNAELQLQYHHIYKSTPGDGLAHAVIRFPLNKENQPNKLRDDYASISASHKALDNLFCTNGNQEGLALELHLHTESESQS